MSNLTAEQRKASNQELIDKVNAGQKRVIKRHSLQSRITHGLLAIFIILLAISGLFMFIPPLNHAIGSDAVIVIRRIHRIIGIALIVAPLISILFAPKGFAQFVKKYFRDWDTDDKKWMALFVPYMFMAKRLHMPDQREIKSGQIVSDGVLLVSGLMMAVTGVLLILTQNGFIPTSVGGVALALHDLFFLLLIIFVPAHIFLGGGIFQPYRGMHTVMWGDGAISESDALYHWAHWAREEISDGEHVTIEKKD